MEENPTLPPRISTQHLLSVESSLEGIYVTLTGLQEGIDLVTRRMEVAAAAQQNQENGRPYEQEWAGRGRRSGGAVRHGRIQQEVLQERLPRIQKQVQENSRRH